MNFKDFSKEFQVKKIEKISRDDKKFSDEIESHKEDSNFHNIFGGRVFLWTKHMDRSPKDSQTYKDAERMKNIRIKECKEELAKLLSLGKNTKKEEIVTNFLHGVPEDDDIFNEIFNLRPKENRELLEEEPLRESDDKKDLVGRECLCAITLREVDINSIPDDLFLRIIEKRQEILQRDKKRIETFLPTLKENFLKRVQDKNSWGISKEDIEKRFNNLDFEVVDGLVAHLEKIGGYYDTHSHKVFIASYVTGVLENVFIENRIDQVYTHEILHALSGKTILHRTEEDMKLKEVFESCETLRIGMASGKAFHWLNEAITESLNLELIGKSIWSSYGKERKLLRLLLKSGKEELSMADFAKAYFEDYKPSEKDRIPQWKALFKKIQESYDLTFLQRLDKVVKKEGIDVAIAKMQKIPPEI